MGDGRGVNSSDCGVMTDAQGRVAMDLANTAADRCRQVMFDAMALCEHPAQQWMIGLQVAAGAVGAAGGAMQKVAPGISPQESTQAALSILKDMIEGASPAAHPLKEESHG